MAVARLEAKKKKAVADEDYDTAKALKLEIENLRNGGTSKPNVVAPPRSTVRTTLPLMKRQQLIVFPVYSFYDPLLNAACGGSNREPPDSA